MPYDILIIDDEEDIRDLISDALSDEGYKTRTAGESMSAFNMINEYTPSLIILDIWLQGSELDGLGILEIVKEKYPDLPIIIISGHGTIETAVSAIKMGAYDYIEKPFSEDKLIVTVKRAIDVVKLTQENIQYKIDLKYKTKLIANSQNMILVKSNLDKAAPTNSRIHIIGAIGTGKDSCARYIHSQSKRANEAFITFDAAAITHEKAMLELFGDEYIPGIHDKRRKIGLLELANSGTLFINEVGDLPIDIQNKLLKFLQDQTFQRPGTSTILKLDIRIISSSTRDLLIDVKEGKFRQDLYYRLAVVPINLPTLSERKEDISPLCDHFIKFFAETSGLNPKKISNEAMNNLTDYNWPGNIRQLRNIVELLLIMAQNSQMDIINNDLLPPELLSSNNNIVKPEQGSDIMSLPLREAREIFEKQYLAAQMQRFNGNISKTSNFVGMERSALHRKLKSLNIHSTNSIDINHDEESLIE